MNKRLAIEDFGYQDFLLIKGSHKEVLEALKQVALDSDEEAGSGGKFKLKPAAILKALVKRIPLGKKPSEAVADALEKAPYSLHIEDPSTPLDLITTERGPFLTPLPTEAAPELNLDDIRLSSIDGSDWVLIEYREQVSGLSMLGFAMSMKLEARDIIYIRRSGDLICEYHNDFHVYRNGDATRRVLCHSTWPEGDIEQEWWETALDGEISPYEPTGLYHDAGEMDLLDNDKLEEILAKLALSSQKLFSRVFTRDPILLSRRDGGDPLVPID